MSVGWDELINVVCCADCVNQGGVSLMDIVYARQVL